MEENQVLSLAKLLTLEALAVHELLTEDAPHPMGAGERPGLTDDDRDRMCDECLEFTRAAVGEDVSPVGARFGVSTWVMACQDRELAQMATMMAQIVEGLTSTDPRH